MASTHVSNNHALFNRAEIMSAAWLSYTFATRAFPNSPFSQATFANCMRYAWKHAKKEAHKKELTALTGKKRDEKIAALKAQRDEVLATPSHMSISGQVNRIDADLTALAA